MPSAKKIYTRKKLHQNRNINGKTITRRRRHCCRCCNLCHAEPCVMLHVNNVGTSSSAPFVEKKTHTDRARIEDKTKRETPSSSFFGKSLLIPLLLKWGMSMSTDSNCSRGRSDSIRPTISSCLGGQRSSDVRNNCLLLVPNAFPQLLVESKIGYALGTKV